VAAGNLLDAKCIRHDTVYLFLKYGNQLDESIVMVAWDLRENSLSAALDGNDDDGEFLPMAEPTDEYTNDNLAERGAASGEEYPPGGAVPGKYMV
jgi:hypothetical protein